MRPHDIATNVLLTGAGFTANLGGLLADEVWEDIFNNRLVRSCEGLAETVSQHWPDFEAVYQLVARGNLGSPEALAVRSAVEAAFSRMDERLRNISGEPSKIDLHCLRDFLECFGQHQPARQHAFWFTLNQDLFPERYACGGQHRAPASLPGFGCLPGRSSPYLENGDQAPLTRQDRRPAPSAEAMASRAQEYLAHPGLYCLKLHGSQNWTSADGSGLLVMGHEKAAQIEQEPILRWYWSVFEDVLLRRRTRLVVVGYSFRDPHVNAVIAGSIAGHGSELVVLDPRPFPKLKEQLLGEAAGDWGAQIVRQIERGRQSSYYAATLRDLFPPNRYGDVTTEWAALKTLLREPLH